MSDSLTHPVASWCLAVLFVAIALCLFRLLRGPHVTDRVVAIDLITVLAAGVFGVLSVQYDEPAYLNVALVVAIVSFLGTVAMATFVRHQARRPRAEPRDE